MSTRIFVLIFLLLFRCVLGFVDMLRFRENREVMVSGEVNKVYYKDTECIMVVGRFLINSEKICAAQEGDKVRAFGRLERRLIESFGGRLWLVSKQIERLGKTQDLEESRTQDMEWLNNFRESLVVRYKRTVPEPEAGLIAGIVLGYKKDIGQEFYDEMVNSGTVHIAVASGYNILLVGGAIMALCFWFLKRSIAIWVAILTIIFYALLAGGDPPVVRAVYMASLMYLGQVLGRGQKTYWTLALVVWVMLMVDPSLVASASFQLSVAASFGLMVLEPWVVTSLVKRGGEKLGQILSGAGVVTSISTMIMTIPIIWWHFGRMSLIGIVSNILILPFVPPLMIFGAGMLLFPWLFSVPTYALAHWVVMVIKFFGS